MKLISLIKNLFDPPPEPIRKKMVYQLYHQTPISLSTLVLLTLMYAAFLKGKIPDGLLLGWLIISVFLTVNRLYDTYRFLHRREHDDFERWRRRFAIKAWLNAIMWGSTSLLFLPYLQDNISLQLMTFIFIMGIAGGAVSAISFDFKIAIVYLFFMLIPVAVYFVVFMDAMGNFMAFLIVLYYLLLLNVCRISAHSIGSAYLQEEHLRRTQTQLRAKQDELNALFQQAPIAIFYFDPSFRIIDANEAFFELFKVDRNRLLGSRLESLPDSTPFHLAKKTLAEGAQFYSGAYRSSQGLELWVDAKLAPLRDASGSIVGGIALIENKTEEKAARDELAHLAHHDPLTELGNRFALKKAMHALIDSPKHSTDFSLLFYLDLNRFKQINDSLGHGVGDQLLVLVSQRLRSHTPTNETSFYRLGGDEFILLVPFVAKERTQAEELAQHVAQSLQQSFDDPFAIGELHLHMRCSIGVVLIAPGERNPEEIIRHADISMYQAKRHGSATVSFYSPTFDRERKERFTLQHALDHAASRGELRIHYQPIVSIKDNRIIAAEALLRWQHPTRGLLTPGVFLAVAIESGIIDEIGWWVIETVCQQMAQCKRERAKAVEYVSINLNASQLQIHDFDTRFIAILERYRIEPREIVIELTETSLIENFDLTRHMIQRLQERGIQCAIDDFGTGYSSLSYLKRFSFSVLKIDRSFVAEITEDVKVRHLMASIIDIAKRLGYRIVVEGIETDAQKATIAAIDDNIYYQGFLFSKPIETEAFCTLLSKQITS